jgi:hypothetical protein
MSLTIRQKQFTCFPSLPKELRFKIWHYARARSTQIVHLKNSGHGSHIKFTRVKPPPFLFVNREARRECLRQCVRISGPRFTAPFYFNPGGDKVYLAGGWSAREISLLVAAFAQNHVAVRFTAQSKIFELSVPVRGGMRQISSP